MSRKKFYLVLDTETATLPFVRYWELKPEDKKKITIAKPIVYDIGWTICDRKGKIYREYSCLVAETFGNMELFDTAYYKDKRPIYLEMIRREKIHIKPWNDIMKDLQNDLEMVDFVGAFNSMFDFKKAIPFTELYISQVYSDTYYAWEENQKILCAAILEGKKPTNKDFDKNFFHLRNQKYPLFDIWGMACETLLNKQSYKIACLDYAMTSNSGLYFKTSAESSYRYLMNNYAFDEAHTALDDSKIETFLLSKILHDKAVTQGIIYFPFQKLGKTTDFIIETKRKVKPEHFDYVYNMIENATKNYEPDSNYLKQLRAQQNRIRAEKERRW